MSYQLLKKYYYKDRDEYELEYARRFESEDAIVTNMTIGRHPAFILQTIDMYRQIVKIHKLDKDVISLIQMLPGEAVVQFSKKCLIDEIVLTNNIEGVSSSRREISEVLQSLEKQNGNRFYGLVQKYNMLSKKEGSPLKTCADIRSLYNSLVLKEIEQEDPKNVPDGKIFRKGAVSVTSPSQKEIHRGVYPESEIISEMEKSLDFLNSCHCDLLIRIAAFHYLLGYIHPFYDGNGRLSRFISSYLLSDELNPVIGYRLSYTIKENINRYYETFKDVNDPINRGDMTPFVLFFNDVLIIALEKLRSTLDEKRILLNRYGNILENQDLVGKNKYVGLLFLLLQASLFSDRGISTADLLNELHISRSTLKLRLDYLKQQNLLECHKIAKEKFYKIDLERFEALYAQ